MERHRQSMQFQSNVVDTRTKVGKAFRLAWVFMEIFLKEEMPELCLERCTEIGQVKKVGRYPWQQKQKGQSHGNMK